MNSAHGYTEGADDWKASPKKQKPLDDKLNDLSSKLKDISHAKRVIKDEKGLPIGFESFNKIAMTEADKANEGREEKIIFPVHPGDWPEDFDHENGNYIGLCRECGHSFRGHKRRFICKICMQPDWENIAKIKKPEDKGKGPFEGCWQEGEMVGYAKCMITKVRELRDQLSKEREKVKLFEEKERAFAGIEPGLLDKPISFEVTNLKKQLQKEREMRKELVDFLERDKHRFDLVSSVRGEIESLIAKATELDKK